MEKRVPMANIYGQPVSTAYEAVTPIPPVDEDTKRQREDANDVLSTLTSDEKEILRKMRKNSEYEDSITPEAQTQFKEITNKIVEAVHKLTLPPNDPEDIMRAN